MSVFFDTNVLIYAQENNSKGVTARRLVADGGKLSVQVLNEFTTVSRRKLHRDWQEIDDAIDDLLTLVDPPLALTIELHGAALALARDHSFSFYNALIVAAAISAGCDTLYTEDMQDGRSIAGLTVCNPFVESRR